MSNQNKTILLTVPVTIPAGMPDDTAARLLDRLIAIGLDDATETVASGEGDVETADAAGCLMVDEARVVDTGGVVRDDETREALALRVWALDQEVIEARLEREALDEKMEALAIVMARMEIDLEHFQRVSEKAKAAADGIDLSSDEERIAFLQRHNFTIQECARARWMPEHAPYIAAAQELCQGGDDVSLDDESMASISDEGAFVLGWIWVSNEEAGVLNGNAELLESVVNLVHPVVYGSAPLPGWSHDQMAPLQHYVDFASDLLSNFAEEIDGISDEVVDRAPAPLMWVDGAGVSHQFMASTALTQLHMAARVRGLPVELSNAMDEFLRQYGNKLDAILSVHYTG